MVVGNRSKFRKHQRNVARAVARTMKLGAPLPAGAIRDAEQYAIYKCRRKLMQRQAARPPTLARSMAKVSLFSRLFRHG